MPPAFLKEAAPRSARYDTNFEVANAALSPRKLIKVLCRYFYLLLDDVTNMKRELKTSLKYPPTRVLFSAARLAELKKHKDRETKVKGLSTTVQHT